MTQRRIIGGAKIILAFLTLGEIYSVYWFLFSVWMRAYPFADATVWRSRLYIWLIVSGFGALLWGAVAVWLFRHRRKVGDTG
jgi:hypothetical protein